MVSNSHWRLPKYVIYIILSLQLLFIVQARASSKQHYEEKLQRLSTKVLRLQRQLHTVESQLIQLEKHNKPQTTAAVQHSKPQQSQHYHVATHAQERRYYSQQNQQHYATQHNKQRHVTCQYHCGQTKLHRVKKRLQPTEVYVGSEKHYRRAPHHAYTEAVKKQRQTQHRQKHSAKLTKHHHLKPLQILDIGMPVFISSYMYNVRPRFHVSALVINTSEVDRDRDLLIRRENIEKNLARKGLEQPHHPLLTISGKLQGVGVVGRTFRAAKSTVDLSTVKLDFLADINPYVLGFLTFAYDNSPNGAGSRIANSRVYLQNGFITIGNFAYSPFYLTAGQVFVPFGRYNSLMIDDSLPNLMGETSARAVAVGYQHPGREGVYAAIYAARGPSFKQGSNQTIDQGGADLGIDVHYQQMTLELGSSFINNLADAGGFQSTGGPGLGGFAANRQTERLVKIVPGWAAYFYFIDGPFTLLGQYIAATTHFSSQNLTFNGEGAQPQSMHVEAAMTFPCFGNNCSIAVSYGRSWQALGINLPQQRYMVTLSSEILANTVLSFEFRHDVNYAQGNTATLQQVIAFDPRALGRDADAFTGQLTVYF